jgi:DtxR family Mn-dependent transcriptional regulator
MMRHVPVFNTQVQYKVSENVEEYLEALWIAEERGRAVTRITWVAKRLDIAPSSVFEMFKKLEARGFINYYPYKGVELTDTGRHLARHVVRNHRLLEVLMKQSLNLPVDEAVACGVEHHMTPSFTEALCILLKHPRTCPHGNVIPIGKCCITHDHT